MSQSPQQGNNPQVRQGILRNPSSQPGPIQRHNSIIPPPADFGEDPELEDDDDDDEDDLELTPDEAYQNALGGRWGEGPSKVDVIDAERDFRQLERTLTTLSRRGSSFSGAAAAGVDLDEHGMVRRKSSRKLKPGIAPTAEEAQADAIKQEGAFDYEAHLKTNIIPSSKESGLKMRTMGVVWKELSVIGEGVGNQYIPTTGDPFVALFNLVNPFFWVRKCTGRDGTEPQYHSTGNPQDVAAASAAAATAKAKKVTKTILYPMNGCCQDGEMILVLGRPGSGCSTLLRVLANDRKNYKQVLGEVSFNNISAETVAKNYKGEVLYNQEGKETRFYPRVLFFFFLTSEIYLLSHSFVHIRRLSLPHTHGPSNSRDCNQGQDSSRTSARHDQSKGFP